MDFYEWAASEAEHGPKWRQAIDRLRVLGSGELRGGYARSTGPLTLISWERLVERLETHRAGLGSPDVRRGWRKIEYPGESGLSHLDDYLAGCRQLARSTFGPRAGDDLAATIHEVVRSPGLYRAVPPELGVEAPVDARASAMAAHWTGASWGSGATAVQAHAYRAFKQLHALASARFGFSKEI